MTPALLLALLTSTTPVSAPPATTPVSVPPPTVAAPAPATTTPQTTRPAPTTPVSAPPETPTPPTTTTLAPTTPETPPTTTTTTLAPATTTTTAPTDPTPPPKTLPPQQERRIVVAPFKAVGVDAVIAAQAAELLALELARFDGVDVVSAADLAAVIDRLADNQLLGCEDPACYVDFDDVLPARRLLIGTVTRAGGATLLQAAFFDVVDGAVSARVQIALGNDGGALARAIAAAAAGLMNADPRLLSVDVTVGGELDADVLARARVAMRAHGPALRLSVGAIYSTSFAFGAPSDPAYPGVVARAGVDVPLSSWLALTTQAWGGYYTGTFVERERITSFDEEPLVPSTHGTRVAQYGLAGGGAHVGLRAQVPQGFVRPYGHLAAGLDVFRLDVSDLVYVPDDGQPDLPAPFNAPIPFEASIAPGVSLELGAGADVALADHWLVFFELNAAGRLHGLEKVFEVQNVVTRTPLAPLGAVTLDVGVACAF